MKLNLKKIKKSRFFKDSSYMVLSTIIMQLIALLTLPVLSRLFTPENFGLHATFRASLVILSIIVTLKLETAIVLPKTYLGKNKVYNTSIINVLVITLVLVFLYFILKLFHVDLMELVFNRDDFRILLLVIFGSFFLALTSINQSMLVSLKKFKKIAVSRLILPIGFFLFSILFYFVSDNSLNLLFAQLFAYIVLFYYLQKNISINFKNFYKSNYFSVIKKYSDIVKYTSSTSLMNTVSLNIPSLLLLGFFGAEFLGFYAIGAKLISLPSQFISASFSQVFYKKVVDIHNSNPSHLYSFVRKVMYSLLAIGIIVFTVVYFVLPYIIPFILGPSWVPAIEIMQYLCLWQALRIVNGPTSTLTILLNKQKKLLIFEIMFLVVRIVSIWLPFYMGYSAIFSILSFAITGVIFNSYLFLFLLRIARRTSFINKIN